MTDKMVLLLLHGILMLLQLAIAAGAMLYDARLAGLAIIVSGFQAKIPFPQFGDTKISVPVPIWLIVALLLFPAVALSQTVVAVDINKAKLSWTWAPAAGSAAATEFHVKCGQTTGVYTKTTAMPGVTTTTLPVVTAITGPGDWFCAVTAANQYGESANSNEVAFSAGTAPSGTVSASLIAQ